MQSSDLPGQPAPQAGTKRGRPDGCTAAQPAEAGKKPAAAAAAAAGDPAAPASRARPHVLLGASGSVASIKVLPLVQQLSAFANVRVVCTAAARHFFDVDQVGQHAPVLGDADEWAAWSRIGDPVLHIEVRPW